MQNVHEERVVLEEIIGLQAAAVANPKVRQEFVVVGLEEKKINKQINDALHLFMGQQYGIAAGFGDPSLMVCWLPTTTGSFVSANSGRTRVR